MAASTPLSHDAVRSVLVQLDGLVSKRRRERELEEAKRSDPGAVPLARMTLGIAQADVERDRTGGWGSAGPPMTEAEAERRDAVRRGIVVARPRRTPRSRRAAHRPSARRTATRAGPSSDDPDLDDPEPEPGGAP